MFDFWYICKISFRMVVENLHIKKDENTAQADEMAKYVQNIKKSSQRSGSAKLCCYDWMKGVDETQKPSNLVEVRFKNTRKDFFVNESGLPLEIGDVVTVEASPGHDIGIVSLTGELVAAQIKKTYGKKVPESFHKIFRKAKASDIEKWKEAKALEHNTMIRSRQIAKDLKLNMKIGDVEYQGDKTKAIFYYIADERVDFRELIKVFADEFKVRIEMRQIGVRQEAGRIGGIGLCGRDLCCSSFITNFVSVSTNAARYQEVSLNPQKMAGQCGKLKCCLNFELASYMDARKNFPDLNVALEFKDGRAHHTKTDVYKGILTYQYKKDDIPVFVELSVDRVKEIIELNKKGVKPDSLVGETLTVEEEYTPDYENVVGQESLTRFDKKKKKKKHGNRNQNAQGGQPQQNQQQNQQAHPQQNTNNTAQGQGQKNAQQGNRPNNQQQNRNRHRNQNRNNGNRPNNQQSPNNGGQNA
ncbi:MAG: hypothetical protein IKP08_07220 [Bacteroidales bacterium]|nr:hypothetical protein [Bacteroidales bacterium]